MKTGSLQTLIKLRKRHVDIAAAELAEVQLATEQLEQQLREIAEQIDANRIDRLGQASLSISNLREAGRWSLQLLAAQQSIEQKQEILAAETERRRQRLAAARQQLRTVELLMEKEALRANERAAALLQGRLDEWSISRAWREAQS